VLKVRIEMSRIVIVYDDAEQRIVRMRRRVMPMICREMGMDAGSPHDSEDQTNADEKRAAMHARIIAYWLGICHRRTLARDGLLNHIPSRRAMLENHRPVTV
jgi:hypothetical protein